jgi:hypothetical protein
VSDDAAQAERIKLLVELACIARGWSRQALAAHLGRDVSRLVPEGGNPKLDYVMKLADALEWPVGDVAQAIWERRDGFAQFASRSCMVGNATFKAAKAAFDSADYIRARSLFTEMAETAQNPDESAASFGNAAAATCGSGHYTACIELATRGLQQKDLSLYRRIHLQVNIAHALLHLWQLPMALAMSEIVVQRATPERGDALMRRQLAFAHYVRGFAHLRLVTFEPDLATLHVNSGIEDLTKAIELNTELAITLSDAALFGLVNTCRSGLLELEVLAGSVTPDKALSAVDAAIDSLTEVQVKANYLMESVAWWAIAGCNISLRSLTGESLQRTLAVFTEHVYSIADTLRNGGMFGAALNLEIAARRSFGLSDQEAHTFTLDREDRQLLYGASLSGETYRGLAWKVLERSAIAIVA